MPLTGVSTESGLITAWLPRNKSGQPFSIFISKGQGENTLGHKNLQNRWERKEQLCVFFFLPVSKMAGTFFMLVASLKPRIPTIAHCLNGGTWRRNMAYTSWWNHTSDSGNKPDVLRDRSWIACSWLHIWQVMQLLQHVFSSTLTPMLITLLQHIWSCWRSCLTITFSGKTVDDHKWHPFKKTDFCWISITKHHNGKMGR